MLQRRSSTDDQETAVLAAVQRRIAVLADTPSQLSFPSSHAASTTAAAILYGDLLRRRLTPLLVPPMLISRLVLGVHYPSDVLVGSALGAAIGAGMRRRLRGKPAHISPRRGRR
jgi:decaprenylphosphoryl-5-phosphoribose phosphatase